MANQNIALIFSEISKLLLYLIPVILIQYGLMIFALVQIIKNEVNYLPKWGWILIVVLVNIIGSIVFLIIGRKKEKEIDKSS
jgi:uncharacterized membrane protein